jgi:hypothetical protein
VVLSIQREVKELRFTPKTLGKLIDELISYCDENGEPPVAHVVRKIVGVTEEQLDIWRRGDSGAGFSEAVKRLDDYRTYFWLKKGLDDPRWASFSTFNLKQTMNGGFSDKREGDNGDVTITLKMEGVGSDAFG